MLEENSKERENQSSVLMDDEDFSPNKPTPGFRSKDNISAKRKSAMHIGLSKIGNLQAFQHYDLYDVRSRTFC